MTAQIIQRGKVLASFNAGTAKSVTKAIQNKADVHSRILLRHRRMEVGYYDLQVTDNNGNVHDSTVEIA